MDKVNHKLKFTVQHGPTTNENNVNVNQTNHGVDSDDEDFQPIFVHNLKHTKTVIINISSTSNRYQLIN